MVTLQVLKGAKEGSRIPLSRSRTLLGRNPDCDICIPNDNVSREHAEIVMKDGKFYLRDLKSRNKTFLNNQPISSSIPLKNNDKISICEFVVLFIESDNEKPIDDGDESDELDSNSTIQATFSQSSQLLLEDQPAEKLRNLLEISSNLNKTLELQKLLPNIVDTLFKLFPQADRAFLIQTEPTEKKGYYRLLPTVVKCRRASDETNAKPSKGIIRDCINNQESRLIEDAQNDSRVQLSQSVVDFRIRSVMCALLCGATGKAFGVIQLDTQDRSKKFTQDDLKLLTCVANQAAVAMENARMLEDSVKNERLRSQLKMAKDVAESFLPRSLPNVPGYEFKWVYKPALTIGGDYYGFVPLVNERLAVVIGDVAGKGIPASLLMARLSSESRFCLTTQDDLALAVSKLNELLYPNISSGDRFITYAVAVIDPVRHRVTLVSAGHPSPMLYRPGGGPLEEVMPLSTVGFPLGLMEDTVYESCQIELNPGESLLFFTDGVTESMDLQNKEFGLEGIQASLSGMASQMTTLLVDKLAQAVAKHSVGRDPHDDVTLVGFGRTH